MYKSNSNSISIYVVALSISIHCHSHSRGASWCFIPIDDRQTMSSAPLDVSNTQIRMENNSNVMFRMTQSATWRELLRRLYDLTAKYVIPLHRSYSTSTKSRNHRWNGIKWILVYGIWSHGLCNIAQSAKWVWNRTNRLDTHRETETADCVIVWEKWNYFSLLHSSHCTWTISDKNYDKLNISFPSVIIQLSSLGPCSVHSIEPYSER